jgi:hypothetical protein
MQREMNGRKNVQKGHKKKESREKREEWRMERGKGRN